MRKKIIVPAALAVVLGLSACDSTSTTKTEARYQEELMQQAADEIGMPEITEYYEKRLAKEIFELRDDSTLWTISMC